MRRLRRILLNTASVLSLLLCVGTGVVWVRSHWRAESYVSTRFDLASKRGSYVRGGWCRGELFLVWVRTPPEYPKHYADLLGPPGHAFMSFEVDASDRKSLDGLKPVQYRQTRWGPGGATTRFLNLRMWLPFACFAILPAARGARRVLRRPAAPGACPACGYDLRATPERCPECGRETAAQGAPR